MRKLLILSFVFGFSLAAQAKVNSENIKMLVLKLKGGEYSGTYNGEPCSVSVIDNGGDGSGYFVRVSPSKGTENFFADFSVTANQEGQVSDLGADSIGVNFSSNLAVVRKPDGSLYVRVANQVGNETAFGRCTISPK